MSKTNYAPIRATLLQYAKPSLGRSLFQIVNTLGPLLLLYITIGILLRFGLWIFTPPLVIVASAFLVRTFILFHDCTHMAFFKSAKANVWVGHFLGILTFTPYALWRNEHNRHHGTVGNLDKRGVGDVWTLTVEEYEKASPLKQLIYRIYRNPIFLFFIAPIFLFGLINRFPSKGMKPQDHISLLITNLGILIMAVLSSMILSIGGFLYLQLTTLYFAGVMGVWLFFVQHQFEEVYWQDNATWEFAKAALSGSSFYKLPRALDWVSGSIGYHHIHHLNPQIPNYNLRRCHKAMSNLDAPYTITLFSSFKLALLHLYDEANGRLISFKALTTSKP